ncbi:MAG: hypothetical protein M1826_000747 [Phylliscum demangeonii]|nr:MAG: hypothetical protein M1826_000747 [Phylliscum demangeonii]
MSSRAIRRAQRRLDHDPGVRQHHSDDDAEERTAVEAKPNLFAILDSSTHLVENEDGDDDDADDEHHPQPEPAGKHAPLTPSQGHGPGKKRKKSKKKAKKTASKDTGPMLAISTESDHQTRTQLDEIDLALKALAVDQPEPRQPDTPLHPVHDPQVQQQCALLAVHLPHLNVALEMRRLFGRAAQDEPAEGRGGRRRDREGGAPGHAAAAAGRNLPAGAGLLALGLRRNIFVAGKEEWPRGTSGGLSMELLSTDPDGIREYRFVHNTAYQDVQRQFQACVQSMEPDRILQLLAFNPYHIATLLQASEIAKHERQHSVAGDMLERALFTFGRSVHSSFGHDLSQGKARLNFRRPENREFWLAGWRYMSHLSMRGTWKTAYEWAKMLLSIDPDGDHYCVRLIIDQLALRSRQPQQLIDLAASPSFRAGWATLANMRASLAVAQLQLGDGDASRRSLFAAIRDFPWVFHRLFQELEIATIPPSVWGSEARTNAELLHSELYVRRAKDVWKVAETTTLLIEVAAISERMLPVAPAGADDITRDEARHAVMSELPSLMALLPSSMTALMRSAADLVPPADDLPSYDDGDGDDDDDDSDAGADGRVGALFEVDDLLLDPIPPGSDPTWAELDSLVTFFRDIFPRLGTAATDGPAMGHLHIIPPEYQPEDLEAALGRPDINRQVVIRRMHRFQHVLELWGRSARTPDAAPTEEA